MPAISRGRRQRSGAFGREEAVELGGVVYGNVGGLSAELRDKLTDARPITLGAAAGSRA